LTIDAMHWVWNHSQSKGTARHCLLALADKAQGADCMAAMGTTEFIQRSNAARSAVIKAVDQLLASGELAIVEKAIGSRPALYRLPLAVGYKRPKTGARGPESGPLGNTEGSGIETPKPDQGSGIRTGSETARGPESGPGGSGIRTHKGPESGPLYQTTSTTGGSIERTAPVGPLIPAFATDLVRQMTAAGMAVTWGLGETEWFAVHAHIKRCGIPFMVAFTRDRWNHNNPPQTARYLTRIWQQMPDLPQEAEPADGLPVLRSVTPPAGPMTPNQAKRALFDQAAATLAAGGFQ
jgi:hypothetical protein